MQIVALGLLYANLSSRASLRLADERTKKKLQMDSLNGSHMYQCPQTLSEWVKGRLRWVVHACCSNCHEKMN